MDETQSVQLYNQPRFPGIIADAKKGSKAVRPYFIVAMLFLNV